MATQTLLSTGTTYVSSVMPSTDLSVSAILFVGADPNFGSCISFLKFAIPSLTVSAVDSAILRLFVLVKTGDSPSPVVVNRVTSDFDINSATYSTMPGCVATDSMTDVITDEVLNFVEIDVTDLVNQCLDGTCANYGIALINSHETTSVQFGGKTIGATAEPQLVLSYSSDLKGMELQLQGSSGGTIEAAANIVFDTVLSDQAPTIGYNLATGEFIITEAGNYHIDWWVATDGSAGSDTTTFSVIVHGNTVSSGNSPILTGRVTGNALITVDTVPAIITLVNETGKTVLLPAIDVQANITIIPVSSPATPLS